LSAFVSEICFVLFYCHISLDILFLFFIPLNINACIFDLSSFCCFSSTFVIIKVFVDDIWDTFLSLLKVAFPGKISFTGVRKGSNSGIPSFGPLYG